MIDVPINDVILNVKITKKTGPDINTNSGMCQRDCLLALLFILYLAFAAKPLPPVVSAIDCQKPLWSSLDWLIDQDVHKITIDTKCADDPDDPDDLSMLMILMILMIKVC